MRGGVELVRGEAEDDKVETHRIDERRGEDAVIGGGDDAPGCGVPFGFEEDAVEEEIPMSDDDGDDWAYDVLVLGPHCDPERERL